MAEVTTPEPSRKISPSKLMGTDTPALGKVGQGGESKVGKLARIVRTTRAKVNKNEKDIRVNIDKLMNVQDEQEQIHESIFNLVEKQAEQKGSGATSEGIEALASNLDTISKELAAINGLLGTQLKNQEKAAQQAAAAARAEKRRKDEQKAEQKPKKTTELPKFKTPKPVVDFFDKIKNFFTQVLLGSAVLGILKWLKDPQNKQKINDVVDFVADNIPIILTSIAAIVGAGIGLKLIGFMTKLIGFVKTLSGLLGPAGLGAVLAKAALGLGGIALTLLGMKAGVDYFVRPAVLGTDKEMADYKLETIRMARAAGINEKTGEPGSINSRGRFVPSGKPRTPEQEKVWEEVQKRDKFFETEKTRRKDIDSRRESDIQSARESSAAIISDIKENNTTQTSRGTKLSAQGQQLINEEKARLADQEASINEQYDQELMNPPTAEVSDDNKPSTWQESMFRREDKTFDPMNMMKVDMGGGVMKDYFDMKYNMDLGGPIKTPELNDPFKLGMNDLMPVKKTAEIKPPGEEGGVTIIGGPQGQQEAPGGSVVTGNQSSVTPFSSFDPNNDSFASVMSIYNAL